MGNRDKNVNKKVKILLVDDKSANLNVLEHILKSDDIELHYALNGSEALKLLLNNEYACCLLDIRMPDMDGFQVAEVIRNDPQLQFMPIIFVTAEAKDKESMFKGYEKGAVDFIQKPLIPSIIRSKVTVFADLFRQRKAAERTEELQQLNKKLEVLNKKLLASNRELKHFTHMAAHDMNEPSRRLRNLVDLLQEELKDANSNITSLLQAVTSATDYIMGLVNDFRALSNIDYGEMEMVPVDLHRIIIECLVWYEEDIKRRNIQIEFDTFPATINVYPSLIKRCYDNLIKNALGHVHQDNFLIRFVAKKNSKGKWVFGVMNTKSKLEESKLNEIFMMYRNFDPNSKGSAGIGLAVCKKIIDRHKGKIWAEGHEDSFQISFTVGEQ